MKTVHPLFIASALLICACNNPQVNDDNYQADLLYNDIKTLIISYSDSLNAANDSASIDNLIRKFEAELIKTNYNYPPETDFKMTVGQQDTISKLTDKYIGIKQSKLNKLLHPTDSIATEENSVNGNHDNARRNSADNTSSASSENKKS